MRFVASLTIFLCNTSTALQHHGARTDRCSIAVTTITSRRQWQALFCCTILLVHLQPTTAAVGVAVAASFPDEL